MTLLKTPRRKKKLSPQHIKVGCAFCWEYIPPPRTFMNVFGGGGCTGGHCECGAVFVVDGTGRSGGQALLDALALACDGDLDRALLLRDGADYEVKKRSLSQQGQQRTGNATGQSFQGPHVWFLKLKQESG